MTPLWQCGEAERVFFLFVERAAGFDGFGDDFAVLLGECERIDDDAEIVEQAGEIGFVGIVVADALGKFAADKSATEGVAPENAGIDDPFVVRNHLAEAVAEENVFDALDAERDDGGLNGFGGFGAAVEGRVGDAQELRGDGFFVGDELDDLVDLHFVGRLVEEVEERLEHGGRGRERAQALRPFFAFREARWRSWLGIPFRARQALEVRGGAGKMDEAELIGDLIERFGVAEEEIAGGLKAGEEVLNDAAF